MAQWGAGERIYIHPAFDCAGGSRSISLQMELRVAKLGRDELNISFLKSDF
jgi:hypothetical protein